MTKIEHIQPGAAAGSVSKAKAKKGEDDSFAQALDRALDQTDRPKASQPAGKTAASERPEHSAPSSPQVAEGLRRVEKVLALLESYAHALGRQDSSLKEAFAQLQELRRESGALGEMAGRLHPQDELRGIMQDVAALVENEEIKMNRGDYV